MSQPGTALPLGGERFPANLFADFASAWGEATEKICAEHGVSAPSTSPLNAANSAAPKGAPGADLATMSPASMQPNGAAISPAKTAIMAQSQSLKEDAILPQSQGLKEAIIFKSDMLDNLATSARSFKLDRTQFLQRLFILQDPNQTPESDVARACAAARTVQLEKSQSCPTDSAKRGICTYSSGTHKIIIDGVDPTHGGQILNLRIEFAKENPPIDRLIFGRILATVIDPHFQSSERLKAKLSQSLNHIIGSSTGKLGETFHVFNVDNLQVLVYPDQIPPQIAFAAHHVGTAIAPKHIADTKLFDNFPEAFALAAEALCPNASNAPSAPSPLVKASKGTSPQPRQPKKSQSICDGARTAESRLVKYARHNGDYAEDPIKQTEYQGYKLYMILRGLDPDQGRGVAHISAKLHVEPDTIGPHQLIHTMASFYEPEIVQDPGFDAAITAALTATPPVSGHTLMQETINRPKYFVTLSFYGDQLNDIAVEIDVKPQPDPPVDPRVKATEEADQQLTGPSVVIIEPDKQIPVNLPAKAPSQPQITPPPTPKEPATAAPSYAVKPKRAKEPVRVAVPDAPAETPQGDIPRAVPIPRPTMEEAQTAQ